MDAYNVRETRENLSKIFKSGKTVEIKHPSHPVIIIPKERYFELEKELMNLHVDLAEVRSKKKYSTEENERGLPDVEQEIQRPSQVPNRSAFCAWLGFWSSTPTNLFASIVC